MAGSHEVLRSAIDGTLTCAIILVVDAILAAIMIAVLTTRPVLGGDTPVQDPLG